MNLRMVEDHPRYANREDELCRLACRIRWPACPKAPHTAHP